MFSEYGEKRLSILDGISADSLLVPLPRDVLTEDVEYPSSGEETIFRPGNVVLSSIVEFSGRLLALQITGDESTTHSDIDRLLKDGTASFGGCDFIDSVFADAAAAATDDD